MIFLGDGLEQFSPLFFRGTALLDSDSTAAVRWRPGIFGDVPLERLGAERRVTKWHSSEGRMSKTLEDGTAVEVYLNAEQGELEDQKNREGMNQKY